MREFSVHSGGYIQKKNSVDTCTGYPVKFVRLHQISPHAVFYIVFYTIKAYQVQTENKTKKHFSA